METVEFGALRFGIEDGKILLYKCGYLGHRDGDGFVGVHIAGENKCTHLGRRTAHSSECDRLTYASHTVKGNTLEIVQNSPNVEVKTVFEKFADTNAVRVYSTVKNTTESEIVLEEASAFTVKGMGKRGIDGADNLHFTRFTQTHYAECQPQRFTFRELGLFTAERKVPNGSRFRVRAVKRPTKNCRKALSRMSRKRNIRCFR